MTLEEVRKEIDAIDPQIRTLLMQRMDCSFQVAEAKQAAGSTEIYRADREAEILKRLGAEVPEDRKAEYLSLVRKIMETSRMYQYGLLYDWNEGLFDQIPGSRLLNGPTKTVTIRLTRPDLPNSLGSLLCMIGDYGLNLRQVKLLQTDAAAGTASFELTLQGDLTETPVKKLMFQLHRECLAFAIVSLS